QPATTVDSGDDQTGDNKDGADQTLQNALNQTGSVVGEVGTAQSINWLGNNDPRGTGLPSGSFGQRVLPGELEGGEPTYPGNRGRGGNRIGEGEEACECTPLVGPNGEPIHEIPEGSTGGAGAGKRIPKWMLGDWGIGKNSPKDKETPLCSYCRTNPATGLDHVEPRSKNGDLTAKNITPACTSCNSSKRDRLAPLNPPKNFFGKWPPSWWPDWMR
ncbi:HNH endonuclease, partial [Kribbella sp. NPDC051620]|uniref:HNH endonuclease n=1 Tax=Kribbella sp. NPDC051620 TaxID=3364120 RepID=UPI00379736BF